ncbi:MAG TPA: hypothetical protein VHM01_12780, partial [Alphaproteobacteria bacterium]|nr:hypothetical protein [Alphaproteobacteria bacterium]
MLGEYVRGSSGEIGFSRAPRRRHRGFDAGFDFVLDGTQPFGRDVLRREPLRRNSERIAAARRCEGPRILECLTQRWRGHYEGDPQKYRDAQELAA